MSQLTKTKFKYFEEDKIDSDFKCAICKDPFTIPVTHISCGNTFCKLCTVNLRECPKCGLDVNSSDFINAAVIIRKYVNLLKVHCPICDTVVESLNLEYHLKTCAIPCALGCGAKISESNQKIPRRT